MDASRQLLLAKLITFFSSGFHQKGPWVCKSICWSDEQGNVKPSDAALAFTEFSLFLTNHSDRKKLVKGQGVKGRTENVSCFLRALNIPPTYLNNLRISLDYF